MFPLPAECISPVCPSKLSAASLPKAGMGVCTVSRQQLCPAASAWHVQTSRSNASGQANTLCCGHACLVKAYGLDQQLLHETFSGKASSHHHIVASSHHHIIITSPHHHIIITSSHHHIHHIIISSHHLIITYASKVVYQSCSERWW